MLIHTLSFLLWLTVGTIQANAATVALPNKLGGATSFTYQYDDLYRLTGATGIWTKGNTSESFTLAMPYDFIHNIVGKDQAHIRTTPRMQSFRSERRRLPQTLAFGVYGRLAG